MYLHNYPFSADQISSEQTVWSNRSNCLLLSWLLANLTMLWSENDHVRVLRVLMIMNGSWKFVRDRMMVITLSQKMWNMSELNIWRDLMIKCVMTKFELLKINDCRVTVMSSNGTDYHSKQSSDDSTLMMQSSDDFFVSFLYWNKICKICKI